MVEESNLDFKFLMKDLKVPKKSAECILETFVLNTSVDEYKVLKDAVEEKNKIITINGLKNKIVKIRGFNYCKKGVK